MGLTRQAVQRVADDLHRAGLIEFFPNPDHARAKLMDMTDKGQDAYAEALRRPRPWLAALAEGPPAADLAADSRALSLIAADRQGVVAWQWVSVRFPFHAGRRSKYSL